MSLMLMQSSRLFALGHPWPQRAVTELRRWWQQWQDARRAQREAAALRELSAATRRDLGLREVDLCAPRPTWADDGYSRW